LYLYRDPDYLTSNACECSVKSPEDSTINVYAVDVRLQSSLSTGQNHTGECTNATSTMTFSEGNHSVIYECKNDTILGEFLPLYSSTGSLINISYSEEDTEEPQSVWLQVTGTDCVVFVCLLRLVVCLLRFFFLWLQSTDTD
jgi:hypothetical protein